MDKDAVKALMQQLARENTVIEYERIPEIDLYMDQLMTFTDDKLKTYKRRNDDKILTKTMINNYSKEKLIPPSKNKKYSQAHIAQILMIYHLKHGLAINDISEFVKYINGNGLCYVDLYKKFVEMQKLGNERFESEITARLDTLEMFDTEGEGACDWAVLAVLNLIIDANAKKRAAEMILDSFIENKKAVK
jgi:DNA-binding transcriptional MerR regulator